MSDTKPYVEIPFFEAYHPYTRQNAEGYLANAERYIKQEEAALTLGLYPGDIRESQEVRVKDLRCLFDRVLEAIADDDVWNVLWSTAHLQDALACEHFAMDFWRWNQRARTGVGRPSIRPTTLSDANLLTEFDAALVSNGNAEEAYKALARRYDAGWTTVRDWVLKAKKE